MFSTANPFAALFKTYQDNVQNMTDTMRSNASGPFGIPTFTSAAKAAAETANAPTSAMDAFPALKSLFPTDIMSKWQEAAQAMMPQMTQQMPNMAKPAMPSARDLAAFSKVSGIDWQALMRAQKNNMEALTAAHQSWLAGCQRAAKCQGNILREMMQATTKLTGDLMNTGTPEDKMGRQADIMREAFDAMSKHLRELADMSARGQAEAIDRIEERVHSGLDELKKSAQAAEDSLQAAAEAANKAAKAATSGFKTAASTVASTAATAPVATSADVVH